MKWKTWEQWKSGDSKKKYLKVKRATKAALYFAKKDAQAEQFLSINNNSDQNLTFKMAERLKRDKEDIVGGKCTQSEKVKLTLSVDDKFKA